jgi:tripartite-type tricarboxylate transporter receptor subunit TctC
MNRRQSLLALSSLVLAPDAFAAPDAARGRLIWGFPPGGLGTNLASTMLTALADVYSPKYDLDYVSGRMARKSVATALNGPADGTAILQVLSSQMTIYPSLFRKLGYSPDTDFKPVTTLGDYTFSMSVGPAVPESVKTLAQYIEWVSDTPERRNIGVVLNGSQGHLAALELIRQRAPSLRTTAYTGTGPMVRDMLAGELAAGFVIVGNNIADYQAGTLRHLAVTSGKRWFSTPDVPAMSELGIENVDFGGWYGWFLPAGTDSGKVKEIAAAAQAAWTSDALAKFVKKSLLFTQLATGEALQARMAQEAAFYQKRVASLNLTMME